MEHDPHNGRDPAEAPPEHRQHIANVSRGWQVLVGITALVFGLPSLAVVGFALWQSRTNSALDATTLMVVVTIFSLFGIPATLAGVRLVFGWRQADGGLMSPMALRVAGGVMLLLPLLFAAAGNAVEAMFALFHVGAAFACFALARARSVRREKRSPTPRA
jgi:hypothetical protein